VALFAKKKINAGKEVQQGKVKLKESCGQRGKNKIERIKEMKSCLIDFGQEACM
jgi:hypothetical protein